MKNYILIALVLASIGFSFTVENITPFPTNMIGGSTYTSEYKFINNYDAPYYAYINISDSTCTEIEATLEGGNCTCIEPNYNTCIKTTMIGENRPKISVSLLPNIDPTVQYKIDVSFSGEYIQSLPGNTTTNLNNSTVMINGTLSSNETVYNEVLPVVIEENNEPVLAFEHDFENSTLDLSSINITVGVSSGASYIQISGVNASGGMVGTKTAYLHNASLSYDSVCVKDAENVTIGQVSVKCNSGDETLVKCDASLYSGYVCTRNGTTLKVSGLKHSTLLQQLAPVVPATYSSNNNGGGSFVGGSSYTPSNDETLTFSGQPLIVRRTASNRTVTLTITNNGSSLGPFTYRETIPYNVTSNDLTFSLQPNSFESGSLIAVWNFNGLDAGNSYTISYTFKSRNVGNLANFKSSFSETPKVVKPEAPKKNTTPVVLNDEKPAIWVPTKLTETMTNISDPSLPEDVVLSINKKESDMTVPLFAIVLVVGIIGSIVYYIKSGKKPPVEPKEPVTEVTEMKTETPVENIKEGEIVG